MRTDIFNVVIWLKWNEHSAKTELFLITEDRACESYEADDSTVFIFPLKTQTEAELLQPALTHFPKRYASILMLENPLPPDWQW